jgi:hypothetical protein
MKTQRGWNNGLPSLLRYMTQLGRHGCQLQAPVALIRKEIPWYLLFMETEWASGPLNADGKSTRLENFQGSCREMNSKSPVLWHSTSTNCATAGPKHEMFASKFYERWKVTGICYLSLSYTILPSNLFTKCTPLTTSEY